MYNKHYTLSKRKQSINLIFGQLKSYAGDYNVSDNYNISVQLHGDQLYFYVNNEPAIKIYPRGGNRFFIYDSNMSLLFKTAEDGRKQSLVIRDGLSTKVGEINKL